MDNTVPIPFVKFETVLRGHPDHVFALLMKLEHGREKHTRLEWSILLQKKKTRPIQ